MNYKISLEEMDKLAVKTLSKNPKFSLAEMKSQVSKIKKTSNLVIKKVK